MPYFKPCEGNNCEGIYSNNLFVFSGKNAIEYFKGTVQLVKNDVIGFENFFSILSFSLTPFVSIYYLIISPFLYWKEFDPDKRLEENLS